MATVSSVRGSLRRSGYYRGRTGDVKRELEKDKTYLVIEVGALPVEKQLKLAMTYYDIEQKKLAEMLGVSPSLVSKWMRGLDIDDKHHFRIKSFVTGNY